MSIKYIICILSMVFLFVKCSTNYESFISLGKVNEKFPFTEYNKVESYSFNRDTIGNYLLKKQIDSIHTVMDNRGMIWEEGEKETVRELSNIINQYDQSIISDTTNLEINPKSNQVNIFTESNLLELCKILNDRKPIGFEASSCEPIYRDALIFKNNNKIVGWINICFDCSIISFYPDSTAYITWEQWKELRIFLRKLGHQI